MSNEQNKLRTKASKEACRGVYSHPSARKSPILVEHRPEVEMMLHTKTRCERVREHCNGSEREEFD